MHIEKNRKETRIISQPINHETFISQVKNWILVNRLNTRQKLLVNSINLTTILAFLPFALGFVQFLNHTSRSSKNLEKVDFFFAKNVPILTEFKEKLNFETFEYISKSNSKEFLNSISPNLLFGKSNFLVTIKKPTSFLNQNFTGFSCNFYLLSSTESKKLSNSNLARNLDELPTYVQALKTNEIKTENISKFFQFPETSLISKNSGTQRSLFSKKHQNETIKSYKEKTSHLRTESKKKKIFSEKERNNLLRIKGFNANFLVLNSHYSSKLPLLNQTKKEITLSLSQKLDSFKNPIFGTNLDSRISPKNSNLSRLEFLRKGPAFSSKVINDGNLFSKERNEFYQIKNRFNSELQTLFTDKSISLFSTNLINEQYESNFLDFKLFKNQNSEISDDFLIETVLQEFEKITISNDLTNFRFMSGYNYPDMTSDELYWVFSRLPGQNLFLNNFLKTKAKRKSFRDFLITTNSFPLLTKEYILNIKKFPEMSLQTNKISLINPESNQIFFTGPGLILDTQRALDWKVNGKKNLRSWFHKYISPLNSLMQPVENFFGVNEKFSTFSDATSSHFSIKWSLTTKGLFDALLDSIIPFSPFTSTFQIPSEIEKEKLHFVKTFVKTIDVNFSKTEKTNQFVTLPLLQLHQPSNSKDLKSEKLQNYSSFFTFLNKGNPDYSVCTNFLIEQNFLTKYSSGSYNKTASFFSKENYSSQVYFENWEPLTSKSWLILTQLSFAIFIFTILKSLAENYGRELLSYLLDFASSLGILDESLKEEIDLILGQRDKGFRVIFESQKNFKDIVGIQKILPEIYEVIWFLRNSAREFCLTKTLPRGILLTGPPGTGKTLLVQALAGEAQVPVIVLSGSSLIEPGKSSAAKLEMAFQEARELSPCIVFIDEIETLAQKRAGVAEDSIGFNELIESLTSFKKLSSSSIFDSFQLARKKQENDKENNIHNYSRSQETHLSLLTQILIELDGIQGREGVIVIGATNKPEVLDPAVLRPGRLDKIIDVGLPGHDKRIEILQFYGQNLESKGKIPWDYLGQRTAGFTAADLATLMNESTIKAILIEIEKLDSNTNIETSILYPKQTLETIEHGIDRLTTSENEKYVVFKTTKDTQKRQKNNTLQAVSCLTLSSKMSILRLAYYQAGKIVLSFLLETHPKSIVASLWPRRPTIRSTQIATNLQNSFFEFTRLSEILDRLVGCYAGKAAEVLFVQQFSSNQYSQLSTLGIEDLVFAQKLVYSVFEKSSIYSKKSHIQQTTQLVSNINSREFKEIPEKLEFYNAIIETIQIPPMSQALEKQTSVLKSKKQNEITDRDTQINYSIPWWQQEISNQLHFVEKNFHNWSRFYLYNPERSERNPEWLPPKEFSHTSSGLKNVKKAFSNLSKIKNLEKNVTKIKNQTEPKTPFLDFDFVNKVKIKAGLLESEKMKQRVMAQKADFSWNQVALVNRDYLAQSLTLETFNKALVLLNNNREFLDKIVVELLYKEILRQPEIKEILHEFASGVDTLKTESFENFSLQFEKNVEKQTLQIIESSWGLSSRKPFPRWIDFTEFSGETT